MKAFSQNITDFFSYNSLIQFLGLFTHPAAFYNPDQNLLIENSAFTKIPKKTRKNILDLCSSAKLNLNYFRSKSFEKEVQYTLLKSGNNSIGFLLQIPGKYQDISFTQEKVHAIAHDFNNLFTSINSSIDLLKARMTFSSENEVLIKNIENCTNRAAEITNELLDKKNQSPVKNVINPVLLVEEVLKTLQQTIKKEINLQIEHSTKVHPIYCSSNDIYRVLLNLGINAAEAIENKGQIKFEISKRTVKATKSGTNIIPGEYVRIKVSDNGSGIAKENLDKIFEKNFSTKNKKRVSGLGLNIARQIIENHNGSITVSSKIGEGSEFQVFLPAYIDKPKPDKVNGQKTILIADDDEMLRELLRELLESYHFNVIEAENGKEVLDILKKKKKIDLLIIDRKMPVINGIECIKRFREDLQLSIPTILSSGSPSVSAVNTENLGIDRVINKPYNFANMLTVINSIIA